ncbi:hypothetical protein HanRHA438_Chr01g0041371 [Helianthus annuus]|nr:hypothetical protein HanRHA438_Chr01g0041371 [Helianthus annuus]
MENINTQKKKKKINRFFIFHLQEQGQFHVISCLLLHQAQIHLLFQDYTNIHLHHKNGFQDSNMYSMGPFHLLLVT